MMVLKISYAFRAAPPEAGAARRLETWLELELQARFAGRIVPIDAAIADRWGLIAAEAKQRGKPSSVIDGLLAATALHRNLTVVSRNASDFTNAQVQVLNPWEAWSRPRRARDETRWV
jgi:predicted nucleic acid-binding protein